MPFMFKLSQRLARLRCATLLLSTAASSACEKPGASVSGPAQPGAQITKVVVSPDGVSLFSSQRKQFTAYGRTEAGDSVAVAVSWSSSGGTISSSGVYVAGPTPGHFGVVATQTGGSVAGSAALTVWAVPVAAVAVSPSSTSVQAGGTVQLAAATTDSVGAVLSGRAVTWGSSNTAVALVSAGGLVTGVATGTAAITATSEGKSGTATVTVTTLPPPPPAPVASVIVSPASSSLQVGGTVQLLATLQDANGGVLSGRVVTWMSSDGSVAIVNGSGLVTAVAPGQATITATSEGKSGSAAITVASPSGGGTVLLQENFDDPAFGVRGWYDNTRMTLSTVEHLLGSTGSLEIRFAPRATQPVWGSAARHLFQPTETVYLSYWVKYSANWVGSGHAYHPHEFYLMTTENGPEDGPSVSHLTVYVEDNYQGGIYPVLNSQDGQNIDQQRIGIDLTAITENRASCGCNGNTDGYATDCYDMGGGTRDNGKLWKTTTPALAVNQWQHVEVYFKLNSIQNGKGVSDGIVRYWVDGRLVIDHSDVLLRTGAHPTMKFNQLLIGPYIGDGSPVDQSLWVDNLTVATSKAQ